MDRETLYLDNDEEITSVVDKMKSAEAGSLDIVIPKEAMLLQSVVNLKLLKKQAEGLSKEITIVTQDKVGKKLAEQIGIPVVASPGDAPKEMNLTEGEPPLSEGDIELRENVAAAVPVDPNAVVAPTAEVVKPKTDGPVPEEPIDLTKGKPKDKSARMKKLKIWGIVGGFATLALLVAGYIFVPLANVTIKLAAEKKKVDITFTVNKDNSGVDTGASTIPGKVVTEDKETTTKYTATGKKKVGEKAKGTATLYNEYQTDPLTIVAGTRLTTTAGLVFKTTSNITVPGFTMPVGVMKAGTIGVLAEADQVGDTYNISAGTQLSVPALGTSEVYATSSVAFTGGSSRDITYVTQADINKAKEEALKSSESELKQAILNKVESSERLLDEALKITQISAEPSVAVNGEAAEFSLVAKFNVKAIVYKEDDLKSLAESTMTEQIGATKELVEKEALLSSVEFTDADFDKGVMHARLAGEAFIATKLLEDKIKTELSGEGEQNALNYLKGIDGVDDAEIKYFPSFLKRVPRIKSHIYIKVSLSKVQE
jgi:hypothetical protein